MIVRKNYVKLPLPGGFSVAEDFVRRLSASRWRKISITLIDACGPGVLSVMVFTLVDFARTRTDTAYHLVCYCESRNKS